MENFSFRCCFCNQKIIENNTDPVEINIFLKDDILNKTRIIQYFYTHFYCFKDKLHQYFKGYFFLDSEFRLYDSEDLIIKNKEYLIKKIIELQNVDQWKVIYYGLECGKIDIQFILDYSYAVIEQKETLDQFILDIAAIINKDELNNLTKKIAEKIKDSKDVLIDKDQYYSKICSYLFFAAEMVEKSIIE